jgi:mono/diheme cytochrome c family protein
MPSFAGMIARDDAWSLVHYVRSLFDDPAACP